MEIESSSWRRYESEMFAVHVDRLFDLADGFAEAGLKAWRCIALLADASSRFVNVVHAAAVGGFIAVPFNIRLSERELAALLADCAPSVLVVDQRHVALARAALEAAGLKIPVRIWHRESTSWWRPGGSGFRSNRKKTMPP